MKIQFPPVRSFLCRQSHLFSIVLLTAILSLSGCTLQIPDASTDTENSLSIEVGVDTNGETAPTEATADGDEAEAPAPESGEATPDEANEDASVESPVTQNGGSQEQPIVLLPLPDILGSASLEISAMDWFGDQLILVPQYPELFDNQLFAIPRQQIIETIAGSRTDDLDVTPIPIDSGLLRLRIPRFYGGFEAIAFTDDRVYLTVEGGTSRDMAGYVVSGELIKNASSNELEGIVLDYENYTEIPSAAGIGNMSEETLVIHDNKLLTIYEANGVNVNPSPVAHQLGEDLAIQGRLPLPNIEYRITDATQVDENGRFWAINYLFPGDIDTLMPLEPEPLAEKYGKGLTHQALQTVERLVEFQIGPDGISLTHTPPIQLELFGGDVEVLGRTLGDEIPRNWEGITRLDDLGFLIATDKFPDTLLAFVAIPAP